MKRTMRTPSVIQAEIKVTEQKLTSLHAELYRAEFEEKVEKRLAAARAEAIPIEPLPLPSKEEVDRTIGRILREGGPLADVARSIVAKREECESKIAELEDQLKTLP